jgi:hypothetical protein
LSIIADRECWGAAQAVADADGPPVRQPEARRVRVPRCVIVCSSSALSDLSLNVLGVSERLFLLSDSQLARSRLTTTSARRSEALCSTLLVLIACLLAMFLQIITRFQTDLVTGGYLYTDSNGREMQQRLLNCLHISLPARPRCSLLTSRGRVSFNSPPYVQDQRDGACCLCVPIALCGNCDQARSSHC